MKKQIRVSDLKIEVAWQISSSIIMNAAFALKEITTRQVYIAPIKDLILPTFCTFTRHCDEMV
jgi:hypothetical protein